MVKIAYKIEHIPIKKLQKNPDNPRLIKGHQFRSLCKSLQESPGLFEARPILAVPENGHFIILGGNMRLEAAKKLKMESVPVIIMNGLTEAQKREIVIKDNGAWGEWDFDLLSSQWADLPLSDWGIILPEGWLTEQQEIIEDEPQIDRAAELQVEWGTALGQIWQLGQHRLMCGDSTRKEDVGRLMGGEKADMAWTDPPWNVAYGEGFRGGNSGLGWKKRTIINDNLGEKFPEFAEQFVKVIYDNLLPGGILYMAMSAQEWGLIMDELGAAGFHWSSTIIWAKDSLVVSRKDYHTQYEPLWYGWRGDAARLCPVEDRKQSDLWQIPRPKRSDEHPTMKPVALVSRSMQNSSNAGNKVFDPFLGSGSTLIACEQTNRICYGMEIDPGYVAVTLQRWKDFTGKEPILVKNEN